MSVLDVIKERKSILVLGALGLGVAGYEWHQLARAELVSTASAKPAGKPLAASTSVLAEGHVAAYPGTEVTLSAELPGKLVKLGVKERDRVKAGDVIAELDVKEQKAALDEALARVREADADVGYFTREKSRSELLFSQNVVAQAELDRRSHDTKSAERRRGSLVATAARLRIQVGSGGRELRFAPRAGGGGRIELEHRLVRGRGVRHHRDGDEHRGLHALGVQARGEHAGVRRSAGSGGRLERDLERRFVRERGVRHHGHDDELGRLHGVGFQAAGEHAGLRVAPRAG